MANKLTLDEFIKRAKKIHGDKYNYSKVEYKTARIKVCIICPEHGEFWQTPDNHLNKQCGCPSCSGNKKLTTDEFINRANIIHNNKYNYSKVEYKGVFEKVCIICPEHGEFWQTPDIHLTHHGCPSCSGNKKLTTEEFITKSNIIHNNKYDYSKVEYKGVFEKVCIICPEHGEFWQVAHDHLDSKGCPECGKLTIGNKLRKKQEDFILQVQNIHNNKYDYSKVEYKSVFEKVCIICPEHGEFWQTPDTHLNGKGCPRCNQSKLETQVMGFLNNNNINYDYQKRFKWLKNKGSLSIDFYLPDYNIAIECQGIQHFKPVSFGGINDENILLTNFENQKKRDKIKLNECLKHGIKIFYINYNDNVNICLENIIKKNNIGLLLTRKIYCK